MDGLIEPSMPQLPSGMMQQIKTADGPPSTNQLYTGGGGGGGDQPRRSSFDDDPVLGFTAGDKRKFSFGAKKMSPVTSAGEDHHVSRAMLGPRVHLSAKQKSDTAKAFEAFDVGGTGYMSTVDLRVALRALGFDARKHEMKKILDIFDKGNTGRLCYADFMTIIEMKLGEDDTKDDILKAFNLFDKDQNGHISFHNLRQVADELGEDVNDEEIAEMLAEADLNDDGTLDQEEFFKILKKSSLY